jgi:hypothetical protein
MAVGEIAHLIWAFAQQFANDSLLLPEQELNLG